MYREQFITEVNRHLCSKDNCISQLLSEIRDTMIFMDGFSTLNFGRDTPIIAKKAFDPSVSYIPVFTNQILCSSVQTLQSIYSCVEFGNFADANVLLRKYRDDLFFYVYIHLSDINSGFYNENSCEKQKKFIENWTHNNLSHLKFSNIILDILNSKECKDAAQKYNLEAALKKIGKSLNNYTHGNGVSYYNDIYSRYREGKIEQITKVMATQLDFISMAFLLLLFLVKPSAASSEIYPDALGMDYQLIEGSQQWVAPFITDFIRKYGSILGNDCLGFLYKETGMEF